MKKVIFITSLSVVLFLGVEASANSDLYKSCATCHGLKGEKPALGKSKIIKDMTREELVSSMNGYKSGTYGGSMKGVMVGQVTKLSSEQIESLATYIKTL